MITGEENKKTVAGEVRERSPQLAAAEMCTGCGACQAVCPKQAIVMKADPEGFYYPRIDAEKCVHCGLCESTCPAMQLPEKHKGAVKAAIHTDDEERLKASSGGAFFALAQAIFSSGGAVCGAVYTGGFEVEHRIAEDLDGVRTMQGSKYVAGRMYGDAEGCIPAIAKQLREGREVLCTGTPCQIAGVKAALTKSCSEKELENLYLVDILCHGVPSPEIWKEYLRGQEEWNRSRIVSVNFRNKERGWQKQGLELKFENGKRYLAGSEDDPYYIMYFAGVMLRPSCHQCPYADRARISDLTLGDYWGNDASVQPAPAQEKGVSLILVNTGKGEALLNRCKTLTVLDGDEKSAYQPLFDAPTKASPRRGEFWKCVEEEGKEAAILRYGRLTNKQKLIKKVIAPLTKKLGIYKLAQKVYFAGGRSKRKA